MASRRVSIAPAKAAINVKPSFALLELDDKIGWTVFGKDTFKVEIDALETNRGGSSHFRPFTSIPR